MTWRRKPSGGCTAITSRIPVTRCRRLGGSRWRAAFSWTRRAPTTVPLHAAEAREAGGADVEQRLVLWAEVAKLPQKEGEAVVLFYYQDWSVRQVADSLGTSDNAVRLRLMRARDRLAQPLKEASIRG